MSRGRVVGLLLFMGVPFAVLAEDAVSPYAGQEQRAIKALSRFEVEGLRSGKGLGMAKPAELNHYPGPRHVLDLADQLKLSEDQIARTEAIYDRMQVEALRLGELIIVQERELDDLFSRQAIDEDRLRELTNRIGGYRGQLRLAHLSAHLQQREILTVEQVNAYDVLRGYTGEFGARHEHHHDGHDGH
jgi:Spy/CpxP family protein refolding chaperone